MKTVQQVSEIYVKNLIDLYIRTLILKNILYILNIISLVKSENVAKILTQRIKSNLSIDQMATLLSFTDDIDSLIETNILIMMENMKNYGPLQVLNNLTITNCSNYVHRNNNFNEPKFDGLNIEKYLITEDNNNANNQLFFDRGYEFKNKLNIEMFKSYFQFFNNDYKRYFSSLKFGVRLNYIIKNESFLQKFNLSDLEAETSNYKEKNWILFDDSTPKKFIFSIEMLKKESDNLIISNLTNQQIENEIQFSSLQDSSNDYYESLIIDLIYEANNNISSIMPIDINDVLFFVNNDMKQETIKNLINENRDFDNLCFHILSLINKYKNFRKF
jgi:hypothetical protein